MEKKWKLHFIVLVYFSSNVNYFVLVISFYYYQFCLFQKKKNQKIKKSKNHNSISAESISILHSSTFHLYADL